MYVSFCFYSEIHRRVLQLHLKSTTEEKGIRRVMHYTNKSTHVLNTCKVSSILGFITLTTNFDFSGSENVRIDRIGERVIYSMQKDMEKQK